MELQAWCVRRHTACVSQPANSQLSFSVSHCRIDIRLEGSADLLELGGLGYLRLAIHP